jgi:endonuclease G
MVQRVGILALAFFAICAGVAGNAGAQSCPPLSDYRKAVLTAEHLFGGPSSAGPVLVRRGYVTEYDAARRVPRWAAWRATPAYLATPKRESRWSTFRPDPDIANPARMADYNGLLAAFDIARGHIVPYFISGGDRDGDGTLAAVNTPDDLAIGDIDDACTVFEVNYMSNIAPQFHGNFNGAGGLWFALETKVRTDIVGKGKTIHIIAGTVFGGGATQTVGPNADIHVPHMFYKILIGEPGVAAFLFVHTQRVGAKGCALDAALESCIVAVADIEAVTGLDFFAELSDAAEAALEGTDGRAVWRALLAPQ